MGTSTSMPGVDEPFCVVELASTSVLAEITVVVDDTDAVFAADHDCR